MGWPGPTLPPWRIKGEGCNFSAPSLAFSFFCHFTLNVLGEDQVLSLSFCFLSLSSFLLLVPITELVIKLVSSKVIATVSSM